MPNQRENFSVEKDGFFGAYSTNPNGVDWCMIALLGGKEGKSGEKNGSKPFWDKWAGLYDGFMHRNERLYDGIAEKMKGSLNRKMVVLELACGTGLISRRIVGSVKSLEATDFSE